MRAFRELTRRVRAFAGRFLESTSGNAAMIFGLVSITVIMAGGAAVDVARAVSMKTRLSSALDAAALAVGTQLDLDEMELQEMAQKYFDANYPASALGTAGAVVLDQNGEQISLSVTGTVDTMLLRIININQFDLNVTNEVTRAANNLEVALALDITGSMKGQQLTDLITASKDMVDMIVQDVQTPYYTKLAIAPYAAAVNVGSYAASIRGSIAAALTITGVAWETGATKSITGASKQNPAVITSANHGFVTGDKIWIHSVVGMTQLNNKPYIVGNVPNANTFQLKNYNNNNVDSTGYNAWTSGGTIRKCLINTVGVNGCELRVTSAGHGFVNGDRVVIKTVTGTGVTAANNDTTDTNDSNDSDGKRATWSIFNATADTFDIAANMPSGTASGSLWSYTSGGSLYCSNQGCEYHRFTSQGGPTKVFQISTCVSDRAGSEAFTDAAPSTALLARVYPASPNPPASATNPCVGQTIMPLSTNKVALKAQIDSFTAAGSTAGQLGTAWGWYLLSPNFSYLWPSESQPAAYGTDHLYKIFVLMTDGEFNTVYCNDVISQSSTSGSGSSNDHKNCNAPNGSGFANAQAVCDAMKAPGKDIIIYTVGFNIGSDVNAQAIMSYCATDSEHEYYPTTGAELQQTFQHIAQEISQLRLSQ